MRLLVLTDLTPRGKSPLAALEFLDHALAFGPLAAEGLSALADADVLVVDATGALAAAAQICREAAVDDVARPILLVVADGALAALKPTWGFDDWVLPGAQPAEVETRLRLLAERARGREGTPAITIGELSIEEDTYVVRLRGRPLDLTYREFALLKHLADNPKRVFTREQLLSAVWGYDYFGGSRTVDVHVRRLRAKLGAEYEHVIGTVRGVGYKLDPANVGRASAE